jgi:hypothetical protein
MTWQGSLPSTASRGERRERRCPRLPTADDMAGLAAPYRVPGREAREEVPPLANS